MKFVTTSLLKIFIFTFIIGILILSIDGVKLKCKGFFRKKPPCTLFINIEKDKFLFKCGGLLPRFFYQKFQMLVMQRNKSMYGVHNINTIANEALDQRIMKRICSNLRVRYRQPTFIKFILVQRRFPFRGRRRSRSGSLSE
uniref:Uncharacterized protein n=1 Tax=Strongyloides stercoralis TaxID=6248 RepID=A0A0K0EFM7_STRER